MKKAKYFAYVASEEWLIKDYREISQVELSVKENFTVRVGYRNSQKYFYDSGESFTWTSSDTAVAKVNKSGVVTGIKQGTAAITGKGKDTGNSVSLTVKVNKTPTKNINLAKKKFSISCGKKHTLKYTIDEGSNDAVHFYSSNENIAWVSDKGTVHSVNPGTAYIAAFTENGAVAYCKVTVKDKNAPKEDNTYKAIKESEAKHSKKIDPDTMAGYHVYDSDIKKSSIKVKVYDFEEEIKGLISMHA